MEKNCKNCGHYGTYDRACEDCASNKVFGDPPTNWIPNIEGEITPADMVNKPNHYQLFDGKDCFDVMVEMFGVEAVQTYCVLNAFTYLFRHARKNGTEDVLKAEYNLAKFKELEKHE